MRWCVAIGLVLTSAVGCGAPARAPAAPPPAEPIENVAEPPSSDETVRWEADEREYLAALLSELRRSGERAPFPRLVEFVARVEALLEEADHGDLTKEQLLVRLAQLEQAMTDPVGDAITLQLDDLREAMRRAKRVPQRD